MTKEQNFSITMRPIIAGTDDIKITVTATGPVKTLQKARKEAREKYPELKSTPCNYWEIKLTS